VLRLAPPIDLRRDPVEHRDRLTTLRRETLAIHHLAAVIHQQEANVGSADVDADVHNWTGWGMGVEG
jgi:hypothetical protein